VRLRLLDAPLERDEGEYAYAGQLLLEGVPPYRLAYNMKLPGTYAAYAAIMALFGQTPRGIHLGLLLVNAGTAVLIYFVSRRLFGRGTAAAAGAAFTILSLSQRVMGVFAHATHFVLLPALAGLLVLLSAVDSGRALPLLTSGVLFGTAFMMKQHGIFFALFALAWLAWELLVRRERASRVAQACGLLLLGAALPFLATCLALAAASVFGSFWFWTFDYARAYVSQVPLSVGAQVFAGAAGFVAAPVWPLWILAGAGLAAPLWDREVRRHARLVTTFTLFSFLSICPGFYFREHYFVLLLPAIAILAATAASAAGRALARALPGPDSPRRATFAAPVAAALMAAALLYPVFRERSFLFDLTPRQASRSTYGSNPFPEAQEIAKRIEADTKPEDSVAILGSEPEIFFYAHRRSATGYIYMYGLMENQPYAQDMQREAIREIEAAAPRYVAFVNVPQSWLARPGSDTSILTWSRDYLTEHYVVAGVADIQSDESTVYAWGEDALRYEARSPYVIYLFKRTS
jgi:hypothetical protein